ncbi:MAG: hypothetical protein KKI02_12635, partial [Planctomycetes bacterium]|nr:hypothetical protein [Planctomycetota bacterium]
DRKRALELDAAATRCEGATKRLDVSERRFEQREFDAAVAELDAIEAEGLPATVIERISTLRAEIDQAREADRQQRAREVREQLKHVAGCLERGAVDQAEALLAKLEVPPDIEPELSEHYQRLREAARAARRIRESLAAVEGALRGDNTDEATRQLDELGAATTLPAWALKQVEQLRGRIAELEEAKRVRAIEQAQAALDAVTAALEAADHAAAVNHLAAAQPGVNLSPELGPRYEDLERAAADLEAWLPKLSAVERALKQGQLAEAYQDTVALLNQPPIPAPVEKRLRAVETQSCEKIVTHREVLTTQLQTLELELEQRGPRAKSLARRIEAVKADPLATQEHRDTAAELAQRFEALPPPPGFPVRKAIAATVVVVLGVVAYLTLRGSDQPVLIPEDGAREAIALALERVRGTYARRVAELPADQTAPDWEFRFEPADGFETTLHAHDETEGDEIVASGVTADDIEGFDLTDEMLKRLVSSRAPPPPPPDARRKIAQALERVRDTYARWAAELPADQTAPDWQFRFEPADGFETTLYARDETGRNVAVEREIAAEDIEEFDLTDAKRDLLLPTGPVWPAELAAATLTELSVDRLSALLGRIAPPEALVRANPPLSVLAEILEQVVVGERSGENRVTIRMVLKDGAGSTEAEFALELETDRWQPAAENGGKLRGLLTGLLTGVQGHVSAVADDIQQYYLNGKLVDAYRAYEQAQALASAFALRELAQPVARLEAAQRRLPSLWRNPGGYEESAARDEDLDYPRVLTRDGRALLLVNVPPNDQLWNEIRAANQARAAAREAVGYALSQEAQKSADERRWHIFYIEAAEPSERVEDSARAFARQQTGRDLPTTDQWLLAALKLRGRSDASGFFGGLWEWCLKDARPWVCGGCDALPARYLPWPDEQAELAQVWAWLNNALVSQPRLRGDSLAGVRTVVQPG